LLPQEIDTDQAEASEKHGLLTIRLPKIDKEKQTKLKVKG
jgi:HSP20 family molecular chaperone IbpA